MSCMGVEPSSVRFFDSLFRGDIFGKVFFFVFLYEGFDVVVAVYVLVVDLNVIVAVWALVLVLESDCVTCEESGVSC